jgi:superkiller protein 3
VRLGEARSTTDLAAWTRAVDAAAQAELLAADADVAVEQRNLARDLRTAAQAEQTQAKAAAARLARDGAMHQRLLAARIPIDDDVIVVGYRIREVRRRTAAYAAAFADYLDGADLTAMTLEQGAAALAGPLAVELATALDHWAAGRRDLERSDPEPASVASTARLQQIAKALDADPWRNQLRALLGQQEQSEAAVVQLADAADLRTLPVVSLHILGASLRSVKAIEKARAVYEAACQRFPADFGCAFQLGLLHEESERWPQAAEHYRIARALRPDMREVAHRLGIALGPLGEHAAEERLFLDLTRSDPDNAHWHDHVGLALMGQERHDEAVASFRRAIELAPKYAPAHSNLGTALENLDRIEEAIASHRRALELEPKLVKAHLGLGNALIEGGQHDEGIESYRRAIEIAPGYADAHNNLGAAFLDLGRLDEAVESCRRAVELAPKDAIAHLNLGVTLVGQNKPADAVPSFRNAIALDAKLARAHSFLGVSLNDLTQHDEAEACHRRAVELAPQDGLVQYNLGLGLMHMNRVDEAIAGFRLAIELDPHNADVHSGLGVALARQGKFDEAIASLHAAIEHDPELATAHRNLGDVHLRRRDWGAAIASYWRASELDPVLADAWFGLGQGLGQQDHLDEAMTHLRHAESLYAQADSAEARDHLPTVRTTIAQIERRMIWIQSLPALARGEREAAYAGEFVAAAELLNRRGDYVLAASTYGRAFAAYPSLRVTWPHPYNAACAAALAGSGKGDGAGLDGERRAALRQQALTGLVAEVARCREHLAAGGEDGDTARRQLVHSLQDPDFAGVRGDEALAALPAAEAEAWRALWQDVAAALAPKDGK